MRGPCISDLDVTTIEFPSMTSASTEFIFIIVLRYSISFFSKSLLIDSLYYFFQALLFFSVLVTAPMAGKAHTSLNG
jgi:hypothetical protein